MNKFFCFFILAFSFFYVDVNAVNIPSGTWRGLLFTKERIELPFNFITSYSSEKGLNIEVVNADEKIKIKEIEIIGDSLFFKMPYFDNDFKILLGNNTMQGQWIKHYPNKDVSMEFKAEFNKNYRFFNDKNLIDKNKTVQGRWACSFESDKDLVVAEFIQTAQKVKGTFLTATGDYRYLEGCVNADKLYLSTFDGSHAYIFTAEIFGDSLKNGTFYSGYSYSENWKAAKNENAKLRNADSISFLKPGFESLAFSFPDTKGKIHSISDSEYKNKVIVIQLMGSWCPNCLDESKFLAPYYKKNKAKGVEVIGLSYERGSDFNIEKNKIDRFCKQIGIEYPVLFAGTNNKEEASKTLPMLSEVFSFPTTIIVDKKGKVRRIHTGFSGPGTGNHYIEYVNEFDEFISNLLQEK